VVVGRPSRAAEGVQGETDNLWMGC